MQSNILLLKVLFSLGFVIDANEGVYPIGLGIIRFSWVYNVKFKEIYATNGGIWGGICPVD